MRDRNGARLFPGDVVVVQGVAHMEGERYIVKGPAIVTGDLLERAAIRARLREYGYSIDDIVEVKRFGWLPLKYCERLGVTFEPAEKSFNTLLAEISA